MTQEDQEFIDSRIEGMFWVLQNKHILKAMAKFREEFEGTGLSFGGSLIDALTFLDTRKGSTPGELISGYGEVIDFASVVVEALDEDDCCEDCDCN